jgi:hypothetical protein
VHLPDAAKSAARGIALARHPVKPVRRRAMATKMSDPRELFLHELGDLLYVEKT